MSKTDKICLIGYGYWGKILHKNLKELGYENVTILDEVLGNIHELDDSYDEYFIATPFATHDYLLRRIGEFKNKKVWCEKPLVDSLEKAKQIYELFDKNSNRLFVDWTYAYNDAVIFLARELRKRGRLKQIILNRTNNGPVRTDADSVLDLASHDLSIIYSVFSPEGSVFKFNWSEFSLDRNKRTGSNLSYCYEEGLQIIINSSWQHESKNRVSVFITDNDEIVTFDDINKKVTLDGEVHDFSSSPTPLHNALNRFLDTTSESQWWYNKRMTLTITETLRQ